MLIKAYYGHSGRKGQIGGSSKRDTSASSYAVISTGFDDRDKVAEFMRNSINENLTDGESNAVQRYSGDSTYEKIRNSITGKIPMSDAIQSDINLIDSAIEKSTVKEDVTLFRGVDPQHPLSKQFDSLKGGEIIEDVSFQSTSLNIRTARNFSLDRAEWDSDDMGIVMKILTPQGTKALPIIDSQNQIEQEFLLPRNSKFKVVSTDTATKEITVIII